MVDYGDGRVPPCATASEPAAGGFTPHQPPTTTASYPCSIPCSHRYFVPRARAESLPEESR
jgi:hypothetical protein